MEFLAQLFMKIMEIRRKRRWKVKVSCEEENEENRGLIHKKAFEDQLVTFCQISFGALSLYIYIYIYIYLLDT